MKLAAAAATDNGRVRTNNEDYFVIDDVRALFAIADGMGGHRGGEVASHTAIESLRASIASGTALPDAIVRANTDVITRAAGDDALAGMGTTLTAVVVTGPNQLLVGHVGDSRAYFLHEGTLQRVTEDHSLVEELVREGRLTPEQAEAHPQRAIITRALGVDSEVDVDQYRLTVEAGDRVIICSDGLNTMVRDRDVERIARTVADPQHAADALVAAANDAGGEDNITVVIVDVLEAPPLAPGDATGVQMSATPATSPVPAAPRPAATVPAPEEPRRERPPRVKGSRLRTFRGLILVLIPLVLILGAATVALGVYARGSYYVGTSGNEVVIYKGVPGGVLGWNPTIDERTGITLDELPPVDRDRVGGNTARGSKQTAESYVARLRDAETTTTTSTTSTTTTTVRKRTTTSTVRKRTTPTTKP